MAQNIALPESLTIHSIEQNYADLNQALSESDSDIVLDAQALENIDTSGLQSLLVLIQTAQSNQKTVQWENVNETLQQAADKTGLSQPLLLQN